MPIVCVSDFILHIESEMHFPFPFFFFLVRNLFAFLTFKEKNKKQLPQRNSFTGYKHHILKISEKKGTGSAGRKGKAR